MTAKIDEHRGKLVAEMLLACRAYPLKRGRARARKYKGVYQPLGDQQEMLQHMHAHFGLLIDYPIVVDIECSYLGLYQRNRHRTDTTILSYDVDNLAKAILDNMQRAAIIEDDRNVVALSVIKHLGTCDSTKIKIYKADNYAINSSQLPKTGSRRSDG